MTGTLLEDMFIMVASRQLLRLKNISDRSQSILFMGNTFPENHVVCEIMGKYMV